MTAKANTPVITIKPANIKTAEFNIRGTAPLVQARFSGKARQARRGTARRGKAGDQI